MRYSELLMLDDSVSSCMSYMLESVNGIVTEGGGINVSVDNLANSLNSQNLKDPLVVEKLKKDIQRQKKWDKLLKLIQKLNALLAGGVVVGGVAKIASDTKTANAANAAYSQAISQFGTASYDFNTTANAAQNAAIAKQNATVTKAGMLIILLIQAAVAVMAPLLKKAIKDREVTNLSTVKGQVDSSIKLYEKQLRSVSSDSDKKKLQDAIDRLKDLQELMDSESERIVNEYDKKSDKKSDK